MKSSQSNFNLRSPDSYSARNYLIATVSKYLIAYVLVLDLDLLHNYRRRSQNVECKTKREK